MKVERDIELWDMHPDESPKAHEAFCIYRDLGRGRSLSKTAHALNHPPGYKQTLWEWSKKYAWPKRCEAYDGCMDEFARFEQERAIREMIERQTQDAVRIQRRVMEKLDEAQLDGGSLRDLVQLWERAARAERTSRGLAAEPKRGEYVDCMHEVADKHRNSARIERLDKMMPL